MVLVPMKKNSYPDCQTCSNSSLDGNLIFLLMIFLGDTTTVNQSHKKAQKGPTQLYRKYIRDPLLGRKSSRSKTCNKTRKVRTIVRCPIQA
jgi:hypothetical protein